MKKLVWLAIGFAIGCFAWRQHQLGDWPFSAGKASADASLPAPSNAPDAKAVAPDANSTRASRSHGSPGEWGGVADPQGILDRSQVTPHLDGAADKARQAMQSIDAAQARERAALGRANQPDPNRQRGE